MILLSIGNHTQQFDRLLTKMDNLVADGKIKDVIAVIGNSPYEPKNYKWYRFVDYKKYTELEKKSSVVVVHAGVGSIMSALELGKPVVVVPRQAKFNEHIDDHQVYTAKELEKQGKVIAVYDISDLADAIKMAEKFKPKGMKDKSTVLDIIKSKLDEWS
ncbi:beta-1,4-galactosyltransferase [archaeon]|nr:MAG: beta-1,4-galactosyltransferase [archaeon]